MLKVKSPMATSWLRVGRNAGLSLVDESLAAANVLALRCEAATVMLQCSHDAAQLGLLQRRVRRRFQTTGYIYVARSRAYAFDRLRKCDRPLAHRQGSWSTNQMRQP